MKKTIFVVIFLSLFITLVLVTLDVLNLRSYINLSSNYDWLSFIGSTMGGVIGGTLTFLGVSITLKYQKKSDDEKLRLSLIPIFEYEVGSVEDIFNDADLKKNYNVIFDTTIYLEGTTKDTKDLDEWYSMIKVKNIGIGHSQVKNIVFNIYEISNGKLLQSEIIENGYKLLKANNSSKFVFMIYIPKKEKPEVKPPYKVAIYKLDIIISYQDMIGNTYSQIVHCEICKVYKSPKNVLHWVNLVQIIDYENFKLEKRI